MKKNILLFVVLLLICITSLKSQNVAITDDSGYSADPSAMLDVKSTTKGMLVPRMTTSQRIAISNPANGLLIFDTDLQSFFFNNGSVWTNLSSGNPSGLWGQSGNKIFLNDTTYHLGVGTTQPQSKLAVQGDVAVSSDDPLFEVINSNGDTIFAVYSQGVRINVVDDTAALKASNSKSGFAVGGFSLTKGATNEYFRVTPDSIRMYIDDNYTDTKAVGSKGGFAIGGFSLTKGVTDNYLFVQDDSTRVYVKGNEGFAIDNIDGTATDGRYMDMSPENYFIGHHSGYDITTGKYNSFFGYETGLVSTSAYENVFIGYQAGYDNLEGDENNFIGYRAGYNNTSGIRNNFIGYESGYYNTTGDRNTFVGTASGRGNIDGNYNSLFGHYSGRLANLNDSNVFSGYYSGYNADYASNCVFIGANSGRVANNSTNSIAIGYQSGFNNNAANNTFMGTESGYSNTVGYSNIFTGYKAGYTNLGGDRNVFIGNMAGYTNSGGDQNIIIGDQAGYSTNSALNVFIGTKAGFTNTAGFGNTYIGNQAGYYSTSGNYNTTLGWLAGYWITSGTENLILGVGSGMKTKTGGQNCYLGPYAGGNNEDGSRNVYIGCFAGENIMGSDKLVIENSTSTTPLIYGDFATDQLIVNGDLRVTDTYFLMTNNPGAGASPLYYSYQGSTNSTSKQFAFAIRDALWVTSNAYIDGSIQVGGGSEIDRIQTGSRNAGSNLSGGVKTVTITFGTTFPTTPMVNVTVRGGNYDDTFAITTRNVTTTQVQVNIYRVDSPGGGWAQTLYLDWMAWDQ